jgi:hypothetical protein
MHVSGFRSHGVPYRERHPHRSGQGRSAKPGFNLSWLILNLCLLGGGCSLFATAAHYYFLGQDYEAKNTQDSVDRARSDYLRTIGYSILGAPPLALGIFSEAKRMRPRLRRRRPSRRSATDSTL